MAEVHEATLVDLLDRVLDRGVVLQADVIISLAGVPLIGLNLRTVLAGIETMLEYGLLTAAVETPPGRGVVGQDHRNGLEASR